MRNTTIKQYVIMMNLKKLEKLRSKLPRGYGNELAKRTDRTASAVYQTLVGKINSPVIIEAAVQLAKETQQKKSNLEVQIQSL